MQTLIAYEDALRIVLEAVPRQPAARVGLVDALGGVLVRDVYSPEDVPAFDNAAMDGFAVRATDLDGAPVRLRVVDDVPAGRTPNAVLASSTCAAITTGAPVPAGADAVVPVEHTERIGGDLVQIQESVRAGSNVRRAAEDVRKGERLFAAGARITPPVLGLLAMLGIDAVEVTRAPRVAVITTGDELVDASATPRPGQIRDANSPMLAAQTRMAGGCPGPCLRAADDEAALRAIIERALAADVLLVAGGMSVGSHDYVRPMLEAMGMAWRFWKVRQRPGKPFGFGLLQGKPVFGLPGNPTTASLCFEMYVRPALARMRGREDAVPSRFPATLDAPVRKRKGLHYFSRGWAKPGEDGRLHVRPQGPQATGFFAPMARANCIIHLPEGMEDPPTGTRVDVEWLAWGLQPENHAQTVRM